MLSNHTRIVLAMPFSVGGQTFYQTTHWSFTSHQMPPKPSPGSSLSHHYFSRHWASLLWSSSSAPESSLSINISTFETHLVFEEGEGHDDGDDEDAEDENTCVAFLKASEGSPLVQKHFKSLHRSLVAGVGAGFCQRKDPSTSQQSCHQSLLAKVATACWVSKHH